LVHADNRYHAMAYRWFRDFQLEYRLKPVSSIEYGRRARQSIVVKGVKPKVKPGFRASQDYDTRGRRITRTDLERLMDAGSDFVVDPRGHYLFLWNTYNRFATSQWGLYTVIQEFKFSDLLHGIAQKFITENRLPIGAV